MNTTRSCEQCGAALAADARFCEVCGRAVSAPSAPATSGVAAPLAASPVAAPSPTNRGLFVGLAIVGVLVVLGCLAVGVFGFWFLQSNPAVLSQLPVGTPPVAGMPTRVEPTVGSSRATTQPMQTVAPGAPTPLPALPVATVPPTLVPGVLFDDDFGSKAASEAKGWAFTTSVNSDRTWSPNQFVVSLKTKGSNDLVYPNGEYDDFGAEIKVQPLSGNPTFYSLTFRSSGTDTSRSSYTFGISSQGEYYLAKTVNGTGARPSPIELTPSPLINRGMSANTLGVIVKGNRIQMYINRTQVMDVYDDAIQGKGKVGMGVYTDQGPAVVAFSRFTVYDANQALVAWCPPPAAFSAGILFEETFGSQRVAACNDWGSVKRDFADALWSPNAYTISVKKPNSGTINTMEIPGRQYADFALETEAQPLDDNVSVYGLVFRFSHTQDGKETYYRFALFPDGRYSLNKLAAGDWVRVVDYTASPLIKTGKNKNILGVIAQGSTFSLYINRTLVKTITDDSIKGSGTIGITAGNAANVPAAATFSRLTVLTPDKAKADWGGTAASAPPTVSNVPQPTPVPPTLAAPPGLYVSALRLDPGPKRGVDIAFYPTFLNTTGGAQSYRVKVYLYRAENLRNSFGETTAAPVTIPVGSTEQKAVGSWKLGSGGCEDFIARVGWVDDQNRVTFFNAPAGGTFEYRFPMCQ